MSKKTNKSVAPIKATAQKIAVKTLEDWTGKAASKGAAPKKPAPPSLAIRERVPTELEAARLVKYKDSVLMRTLAFALSKKRPHEGVGERNMLGHILLNRPDNAKWTWDETGNLHIDMRRDDTSKTLFVAHVDTVHRDDGYNKIRMTESVWYAQGSQLGADDGSGIALLMHLMHAGVPGYYLFTIGEECGGIGSSGLVKNRRKMLKHFDRAIAFDRKGNTSVISHQGSRCCSDAFAEALSTALSAEDLLYMPDDGGVYTDTAEFVDDIPECTNISVGYMREHSAEEAQDILHLQALADVIVTMDWDALPTVRDPAEIDPMYSRRSWTESTDWSRVDATQFDDFDFKLLMDEDEVDAYEALHVASLNGSTKQLAVHMAAVAAEQYLGTAKEMLGFAEKACARTDQELLKTSVLEVQMGADISNVLFDLFEMGHEH
jgi:hypothetical protein